MHEAWACRTDGKVIVMAHEEGERTDGLIGLRLQHDRERQGTTGLGALRQLIAYGIIQNSMAGEEIHHECGKPLFQMISMVVRSGCICSNWQYNPAIFGWQGFLPTIQHPFQSCLAIHLASLRHAI